MNESYKDLKKLNQKLRNKSIEICNKYLEDLFNLEPKVKYARNSFEFENPYPSLPGFENKFDLVNIQNQMFEIEELVSDVSEEFSIPKIFNPKHTTESLEKLKNKLIKDDKLAKFNSLRKDDVKATGWLTTISSLHGLDLFYGLDKAKVINDQIYLNWSCATFSYIRDFEILVKIVIDPCFSNKNLKTYTEKIQAFFGPSQNNIFENYAKPYVRSKIAHQQYLVNIREQKIIFFKDEYFSRSVDKEISLIKLTELTVNISLLLWICLIVLFEKNSYFVEFVEKEKISKLKSHPLFNELEGLEIFNDFNVTEITSELSASRPIYESYVMIKFFLKKEIPSPLYFMQMQMNISYLMSYSLLEERFIKPLAKSYDETIDLGTIKDKEMLEIIKEKVGEEFLELIEDFKPEARNIIAHLEYYTNENDLMLYKDEKKENLISINSISLSNLFNKVEYIFDEKRINIPKFMAIGQLINEIYFHPSVIDNSREKIVIDTIFTMHQKFYPLISIYLLISALSRGVDKIEEYVIKANNNKYFRKEDIKVIWATVYLYAMRIINDQNKNNIKVWIRQILNKFDSKPLIKKDITFISQINNFFTILIS